ncbi:uncharacterized protein [Aristolochia californica]|uniref:uncharacterized protein n=1 Tax=Aristolochia californica TaxID=171875 RepID=UPI0035DA1404
MTQDRDEEDIRADIPICARLAMLIDDEVEPVTKVDISFTVSVPKPRRRRTPPTADDWTTCPVVTADHRAEGRKPNSAITHQTAAEPPPNHRSASQKTVPPSPKTKVKLEEDLVEQVVGRDDEMVELEKEYSNLRSQEQDLLKSLTLLKNEDLLKGQAVKNQKALWDKTLELRFLLQKAYSNSNKLPQEPMRSSFCKSDDAIDEVYNDLVTSAEKTLNCILELQEAILEKNPAITQSLNVQFRNSSIDKWQRKTQVTTGAAAFKGKLHAFNQNISDQVAAFMRDPSRVIERMQLRRSSVGIIGEVAGETVNVTEEGRNVDGDPELLDDSEFYQQLLKEFLESCDLTSSETTFYALKKLQTKKRKIVDRRASKSRKIRYNVHQKIVNFMDRKPIVVPPMAPQLFENLFGLRNKNTTSVA